ncbi:hypothetical protein [Chelatococcus reniformis]|uniref:DUF305 domain-containing protein n=1 Tax=Chelatococcus reniformis TaxID=1494448 RepID=A0A916X8W5_9HYPH|nr:hypothetical protein [Chelatococcus reniformis]GGC55439.1 hypothetical protein GCM10010994_12880 [Chelatococcus reniformis]
MRRLSAAALGLGAALVASTASGQSPLDKHVSDGAVKAALNLALTNISRAKCEDLKPCAAPTADEKAHPPISIAEARAAMKAGIVSGIAEHCGLDWHRRTFVPMMVYHRKAVQMNERQMALMGLLHGMQQARVSRALGASGTCSADMKAKVNAGLPAPE